MKAASKQSQLWSFFDKAMPIIISAAVAGFAGALQPN